MSGLNRQVGVGEPVTASENTKVTTEVSPAFSASSANEMLFTVGATVSLVVGRLTGATRVAGVVSVASSDITDVSEVGGAGSRRESTGPGDIVARGHCS